MGKLSVFFKSPKAQAEVLSVILIAGISIAAVSVAYLWGIPMIQKGQSTSQLHSAESVMAQVYNAVSEVLRNGGQKSVTLELEGPLEVLESENAVVYTVRTKKAGVASTEWTPMNEDETFGVSGTPMNQTMAVYGADKDAVIMARAAPEGDQYVTEYRLSYRELDDLGTKEGWLVSLVAVGNNKVLSGRHTLTVAAQPPIVSDTSASKLGGTLTITKAMLTLS